MAQLTVGLSASGVAANTLVRLNIGDPDTTDLITWGRSYYPSNAADKGLPDTRANEDVLKQIFNDMLQQMKARSDNYKRVQAAAAAAAAVTGITFS